MAPKQQKLETSPVVATTYLAHRKDGKYLVRKVSLLEDGTTKLEPEFEHPNRMVARERLRVLLDGVLP